MLSKDEAKLVVAKLEELYPDAVCALEYAASRGSY